MTQDTQPTPTEKPRMRRGMRIILIASLALNVIVVGLIIGAVVGHSRDDDRRRPNISLPPHVRALDWDHRREIGKAIRKAYRADGLGARTERSQLEKMAAAIEASPFDRASLEAVQVELESVMSRRVGRARDIWLDHVESMTDRERAAYADRLRHSLTKKKRDKDDHD
ncbi:hypothetical protein NBRC116590_25060 [Pelagimonas sp. KU-00592-HH]|uniref:periplasmic heavy metal sensor n=1 Tax=Pelagimonas sp. KU-00592-HH TaxID=3127651 RepID=UPI00310BDB12